MLISVNNGILVRITISNHLCLHCYKRGSAEYDSVNRCRNCRIKELKAIGFFSGNRVVHKPLETNGFYALTWRPRP